MSVTRRGGRFATRFLKFGIIVLVIGVLIYFASRSVNGGWAGILLAALLAWPFFTFALFVVQGIWKVRGRIKPRHQILGGCLSVVGVCGVGGLLLIFGPQALVGVFAGAAIVYLLRRPELARLPQLAGLLPAPAAPGAEPPPALPPQARWAAAAAGVVCLLAGLFIGGLGTIRVLEGYVWLTDSGCTHPCGMVDGLWVQVIPDAHGAVVSRLDPATVQLRVRFKDDVAGDKVASRDDFALVGPSTTFPQVAGRHGCDPWASRVLHIDETTSDLTLCFTLHQSDNVDLTQLLLDWKQRGGTAPIYLGAPHPNGLLQIGISPSPSQP